LEFAARPANHLGIGSEVRFAGLDFLVFRYDVLVGVDFRHNKEVDG